MAKAMKTYRTVEKTVKVTEPVVHLELNPDEVDTLVGLFGFIGGHPDRSPRKHVQAMNKALGGVAGVDYFTTNSRKLLNGSLNFMDFPTTAMSPDEEPPF